MQSGALDTINHITSNAFAYASHLSVSKPVHPRNVIETLTHPRAKEYKASILKEIQAHKENKSYKFIDITKLPPGSNVINTGFVFDIKYDALTKTEIVKSRLVAKGCGQKIGEDYSETYAPTVDPITIRMALAWAIQKRWLVRQLDIKAAFLIPPLPKNEIVYSRAPKGYAIVEKWLGNKSFNEKTTLIVWVKISIWT